MAVSAKNRRARASRPSRRRPKRRAAAKRSRVKRAAGRRGRRARRRGGFRLSGDARPSAYRIALDIDPERERYSGEVSIRLDLARPRRSVELHAVGLRIQRAAWRADALAAPPLSGRAATHGSRETVEIRFPKRLRAGPGTLVLRFAAKIQKGLRGLYGVRSDGRAYAFTQLEAADARRFFPCFDEPSFKASFTFVVTTPAGNTVISNSPAARIEERSDGRTTVEFAATPKLSTYLCALAVGPLECSEARLVGPTETRVWHVPGKGQLTGLALEAAVESLTRLERYFGLPYPYGKLDLVAVPDFEAGAMENAGAVFFRETLLLADPAAISLVEHKALAEVITHELAHMWYGNLVTMAWWDDLWLNEAFATWMAFRIVDEWKPAWRIWNAFEHHRAAALNLDALTNTHPIYGPVRNVSEATENFDLITYEKGAAVVRMLERYLGADAFREGVRTYIHRHREGNATAADLWRALSEASGTPVDHIARGWTERPGFPLLTVSPAAATGTGRATLDVRQERFYAHPGTQDAVHSPWPVPWVVRYRPRGTTGTALGRHLVDSSTDTVSLDGADSLDWYYGNADEGGFFRVRHDDQNLKRLTAALPAALSPVERMGLLGNQWALVRSDRASIESFLEVADGFERETDHDVLERLATALAFIDDQLLDPNEGPVRAAFRSWLERRFMPQLVQLGWDARSSSEPDESKLRRAAIVRILGEIAAVPTVCSTASARAARYVQDRASLDANLVDTIVLVGARLGDAARFDRYRTAAVDARTPQDRRRFQLALAEFRLPDLIERALALTLTDAVPTQDVAALLVRAIGNRAARERAWRFITRSWASLHRRLPPMMVTRLIDALPALQTPTFKREFTTFFRTHPIPTAARAVKQALERFDLNHELRQRAAPGLAAWFTNR